MKELAQSPVFDPTPAAGAYIASATRDANSAAFAGARFRSYRRAESDSLVNTALDKE
jgi:hypothetical protein